VGFLGAAQIDRWGNVNTTVIGDYEHPKVRLPGSGGAPEIATHARRTLLVAPLSPRTFPAEVDFITSPGHRCRGRSRAELGLPGLGPMRVITDLGILAPEAESGELVLVALYPGRTIEEVRSRVGWPLRAAPEVETVDPPGAEELRLLREELDPERRFLPPGAILRGPA
jgi:glutaconate CoA-transferase subunit B